MQGQEQASAMGMSVLLKLENVVAQLIQGTPLLIAFQAILSQNLCSDKGKAESMFQS